MFANNPTFNQSLGNWNLRGLFNVTNMLDNSGMDCDNYSATLIGWNNNPATPNGLSLGASAAVRHQCRGGPQQPDRY